MYSTANCGLTVCARSDLGRPMFHYMFPLYFGQIRLWELSVAIKSFLPADFCNMKMQSKIFKNNYGT